MAPHAALARAAVVLAALLAEFLLATGVLVDAFLHGDNVDKGLSESVGRDPFVFAVAVALEADGAAGAAFAVVELDRGFVARAGAASGPDGREVVARKYLAGDLDVVFCRGEGEADLARVVLANASNGRRECGVEGGG